MRVTVIPAISGVSASASAPPVPVPACVAGAFPVHFVMAAPWSGPREFYAEGYSVFHGGKEWNQARLLYYAPELYEVLEAEAKQQGLGTQGEPPMATKHRYCPSQQDRVSVNWQKK